MARCDRPNAIPPDAPEGVGNMALRAATFDSTGKFLKESVVDPRVCECCPTAAAETSDGVIVAYRNRSAGEVRDIYVARLVNVDPELALRAAAERFRARVETAERLAAESGETWVSLDLEAQDAWYRKAKEERASAE